MIPIILTLPITALLATVFFGLLVFFNNPKNSINKTFSFLTFFGAFWIFSVFIADLSKDPKVALFWTRMAIVGPALIPATFFYFSLIFPSQKIRIKFSQIVGIFSIPIIFLVLVPTRFNVEKISIESWGTDFTPGILYKMLFIYFAVYFVLAFKKLFNSYRKSIGIEKSQILYVFLGFFLAVIIGLSTNLILPLLKYTRITTLGPSFSIIVFVGLTAYAVLKHYLMNIKVIATEILVFSAIVILVIEATLSKSVLGLFFRLGLLGIFILIGYLLIKSVLREIKYREQLQKTYEELKELDVAKSEFISMASHQLRTPLTAIKGYISMILEGTYGKLPDSASKPLNNILTSGERLIRIVNDLLDISKIELGKIELNMAVCQLEDLIQSCYEELKEKTREKNLKFIWQKPKIALPKIRIDELKIRQAITNLIDNAIRYTKKGKIEIKAEKEGFKIQISIRDTGEGLSKEEEKKIFESFARGSAGINLFIEGAGLGLYVARKFVELHNGRVWAESKGKGKGSIFYIELPIKS